MEAEHTALLCYCTTRWISRAKMFHWALELKEYIAMFLSDSSSSSSSSNANFFYK